MAKGVFLALVDRFRRTDEIASGAGLDLDKNQDVVMTADEVDLAAGHFVIAGQDAITMTAQEAGRDALTISPDLRRRRQLGRGRAFVSAQTFADELGKVREG